MKSAASKTVTTTTNRVLIQRADLIEFLKSKGLMADNAIVQHVGVHIPGGGDYSNCDIEINDYENGEDRFGVDVVWTTEVSS